MRIPIYRYDRRLAEQASPPARSLYRLYRAFTWIGHIALSAMLVTSVILLVRGLTGGGAGPWTTIWFVTFFGAMGAYLASHGFETWLDHRYPGDLNHERSRDDRLISSEQREAALSAAASDPKPGPAEYGGLERATVAATIGECHLLDDIARTGWPRPDQQLMVFADDDLRLAPATCTCGRLYLWAWRRVRQSYFEYLVPVEASEVARARVAISAAPKNATDTWLAAERAVIALASDRPTIEYSPSPAPSLLRWLPPGRPLAFTVPPF